MTDNDDLDLGLDEPIELIEVPEAQPVPKKKATTKKAAVVKAEDVSEPDVEIVELDPEYDRENWPTVLIDFEQGKPNYEFVAAHGTCKNGDPFGWDMQIQRGVNVKVPPSIVYALRDARGSHYTQTTDPSTGKTSMLRQDRSAIPWTLVSGGKYI